MSLPILKTTGALKVFKTPGSLIEELIKTGQAPSEAVVVKACREEIDKRDKSSDVLVYAPDYFSSATFQDQWENLLLEVKYYLDGNIKIPIKNDDSLKEEIQEAFKNLRFSFEDKFKLLISLADNFIPVVSNPNAPSGLKRLLKNTRDFLADKDPEIQKFYKELEVLRARVFEATKNDHRLLVLTEQSKVITAKIQHDKEGASSDWVKVLKGRKYLKPDPGDLDPLFSVKRLALILGDKSFTKSNLSRGFQAKNHNREIIRSIEGARNFRIAEYLDLPNLGSLIDKNEGSSEERLRAVLTAMQGMVELHEQGIANLDFKPDNILVKEAALLDDSGDEVFQYGHGIIVDSETFTRIDSFNPMQEEIIADNRYHPRGFLLMSDDLKANDIFTAALVLVEVIFGREFLFDLQGSWETEIGERSKLPNASSNFTIFTNSPRNRDEGILIREQVLRELNMNQNYNLEINCEKELINLNINKFPQIPGFPLKEFCRSLYEFSKKEKRSFSPGDLEELIKKEKYLTNYWNKVQKITGSADDARYLIYKMAREITEAFYMGIEIHHADPNEFKNFAKSKMSQVKNVPLANRGLINIISEMFSLKPNFNTREVLKRLEAAAPEKSKIAISLDY